MKDISELKQEVESLCQTLIEDSTDFRIQHFTNRWYENRFEQDPKAVLKRYPNNIFHKVMENPNSLQILSHFKEADCNWAYWGYYDTEAKRIYTNYPRSQGNLWFFLPSKSEINERSTPQREAQGLQDQDLSG